VIKYLFCHLGTSLIFEPGFLPVWWVMLPLLVPVPHWVLLCIQDPHPNLPGGQVPPRIKLSVGAWWDHFSRCPGDAPQWQERWKIIIFQIPDMSPQNVARISNRDMGLWGSTAGSNVLLCRHGLKSKVWAPRTKRSHLIYSLQAGYRSKTQDLTHIWLHASLLATSPHQC
jgi:hypothetical protein